MPVPSISQRGLATPASPIRKLASYADQAKARGIHIYHLNIGQPDIPTPPEFYQALSGFREPVLAYGPSDGLKDFRESMVQYYHRCGYDVEGKHVLITTAGSEAVLFAMMAVASPGEEVLTFEPFYPNYNGFAHMAGIRLVPVETDPETGYHLPPVSVIEKTITPRTKAILICSPNNPTGTILTRQEMETIARLAVKHNLFILSDEVYREFAFDGVHTSIMSFPEVEQYAIMLDSLSKRYSACGARIGCVVSKNREVMETVLKFAQARLCPPTLEQRAAMAVVQTGDRYFKDMLIEYKSRRDALYSRLMAIPGVKCTVPQGAFYTMVSFPVQDIEDFCRWMLTDFHVDQATTMMAPGPGFYATPGKGKQEARIAYVLNVKDIGHAIDILEKGLKKYNS